jgi:hypothetical protein
VHTTAGCYRIERGVLAASENPANVWSLSTPAYDEWLSTVRSKQAFTFDDVARVRVGIKTTADEVFIRSDWSHLPAEHRPEPELLRPLITHHDADRWSVVSTSRNERVLYPHYTRNGRREPVELHAYPKTKAYFERHEARLSRRKYVIDSGRRWYEIWVPHNPEDWAKPKIVFPDISAEPRFGLDASGAVVQGDCYWITLRQGISPDVLLLMLAVANSRFITRFYDIAFHNKLYSGRRRFMTQYVKEFPLPDPESGIAKKIIGTTRAIVQGDVKASGVESEINALVSQAFGLVEEI